MKRRGRGRGEGGMETSEDGDKHIINGMQASAALCLIRQARRRKEGGGRSVVVGGSQ